jgi:predicted HAD superfamily Cof-like phosphohydrolase
MHYQQQDVAAFAARMGHPRPLVPTWSRTGLRIHLIEEEADETCDAIAEGDWIGTIDGLCDLLYVTYGAAVEFGIDLAPFWNEVHRSNMDKAGGPIRLDGKAMKPEGWVAPDIEGIFDRHYGHAMKGRA